MDGNQQHAEHEYECAGRHPSVVDGLNDAPALPASALDRVRSVQGVLSAMPLALATADARFPNGRFQAFQVTGVDDATLSGVPIPEIESVDRRLTMWTPRGRVAIR